jgi:hypothetical protein
MGYEFLETTVAVPGSVLQAFCLDPATTGHWFAPPTRMEPAAAVGATPGPSDPLTVSTVWTLGGQVVWAPPFAPPHGEGVSQIYRVENHCLLTLQPTDGLSSTLQLEVFYEPFADAALWELFTRVFAPPRAQLLADLAALKQAVESAYLTQLFAPQPAAALPTSKRLKITPAA